MKLDGQHSKVYWKRSKEMRSIDIYLFLVHTNQHFTDAIQAYYAGLMEGVITHNLIKNHWDNTIGDYCSDYSKYCTKLEKFLQDNLDYMNEKGNSR